MSMWEYSAAMQGYIDAHVPDPPGSMNAEEEEMLWAAVEAKMGRVQ